MNNIKLFFKKYIPLILKIIFTFIGTIITSYTLGPSSDYIFTVNMVLAISILFFIYRMCFKKIYKQSAINIICILSIIIAANHLYSYKTLSTIFPWLKNIDQGVFISISIAIFLIIIIIIVLLNNNYDKSPKDSKSNETIPNNNNHNEQGSLTENNKSNHLHSLLILFIIISIFAVSIWLYYNYKWNINELLHYDTYSDLLLLMSSLIGYGASILFIIFSVGIIALALIELAKLLYTRILMFSNIQKEEGNKNYTLTYSLSILIVIAMLFLTYKVSDFTMDKFTEIVSAGDYLALPLIILLGIVVVFLFIRLTHGVLLLIMKSDPINVEQFIQNSERRLQLKTHIIDITESMVNVVFGTIKSAFKFVEFIPDFFESLSVMVLDEDESEDDDKEQDEDKDDD